MAVAVISAEDEGFEGFYHLQYPSLRRWLMARGASPPDAEDVAQTAFTQVWRRWQALRHPAGYLYRVAANELGGLRQARSEPGAVADGGGGRADQQAPADIPYWQQASMVRQCLLALPPRQREAMAGIYDGVPDRELAQAVGTPVATLRSNRRHARSSLRPYLNPGGPDPGGRVLRQAYAEMRGGNFSPAGSRLVISESWARSARYQVNADHGTLADPLDADELAFRRRTSPLSTVCPAICAKLAEAASATGLMAVAVDAGGWVIWRTGDRSALRRADRDGHTDGALLSEQTIGTSGVSIALTAGHPVLVRGPEHYTHVLHDLACAAAPIRHPHGGRLLGVLNLTAPNRSASPLMLKLIDEMTRQAERHLATST